MLIIDGVQFFLAVLATIQIVYVKYGFGHHQWEPEILENNALLLLVFVPRLPRSVSSEC